nr:MAG TPA: hypothetical protein [Bacteriophage sp.]
MLIITVWIISTRVSFIIFSGCSIWVFGIIFVTHRKTS